MALMASGSNKEFKQVPEGSHMARCFRIIDLGTQRWEYQGEPQIGRKVLFMWELSGEADDGTPLTTDDGRPMAVSKKYTLSLGKKANLRADLESWRGKAFTEAELAGFDIGTVLGQYCMVSIKHDKKGEKTYANVANVTRWPAALKGQQFKPVNPNQLFDINEHDQRVFDELPEWVTKMINESVEREWHKAKAPNQHARGTGAPDMGHAGADIPAEAYMDDDGLPQF